jgi:hypothetical protein
LWQNTMLHSNPDEERVCLCEKIKSQDEMWLSQPYERGGLHPGRRRLYRL